MNNYFNIDNTTTKSKSISTANGLAILFIIITAFRIFYNFIFFGANDKLDLIITFASGFIVVIDLILVFFSLPQKIKALWILIIISLLLSYITHFSGAEYICNTVIFLGIITLLPYLTIKRDMTKLLVIIYSIYTFLIITLANRFGAENKVGINTNTSGFVICLFEMIMIAFGRSYSKNAIMKYICYIMAVVAVWFQFQFAGRSSLIGTAFLLFYIIFMKLFNSLSSKSIGGLIIILGAFGIIFAYLYAIVLFNLIGHGNVTFMGKDIFTGRQIIWSDAFEQLKGHWLFGIGNNLKSIQGINNDYSGNTNLHNQMMGNLTCFGIIFAILYIILYANLVRRLNFCARNKFAVAITIIFLIMSYFDTILYSSTNMPFVALTLIIAYSSDKITFKKERKCG